MVLDVLGFAALLSSVMFRQHQVVLAKPTIASATEPQLELKGLPDLVTTHNTSAVNSVNQLIDQLVVKLFKRVLNVKCLHRADVERTTLGKEKKKKRKKSDSESDGGQRRRRKQTTKKKKKHASSSSSHSSPASSSSEAKGSKTKSKERRLEGRRRKRGSDSSTSADSDTIRMRRRTKLLLEEQEKMMCEQELEQENDEGPSQVDELYQNVEFLTWMALSHGLNYFLKLTPAQQHAEFAVYEQDPSIPPDEDGKRDAWIRQHKARRSGQETVVADDAVPPSAEALNMVDLVSEFTAAKYGGKYLSEGATDEMQEAESKMKWKKHVDEEVMRIEKEHEALYREANETLDHAEKVMEEARATFKNPLNWTKEEIKQDKIEEDDVNNWINENLEGGVEALQKPRPEWDGHDFSNISKYLGPQLDLADVETEFRKLKNSEEWLKNVTGGEIDLTDDAHAVPSKAVKSKGKSDVAKRTKR
eukprot:gnl/MRDRNA2_/MRDRNA2_28597_c0_seq2.p1 gnl/MRDRNA2_/MRDRNA2_28597_c0~~gnl/MRDRNA2_/MRDRNA2_28597_c0_seq2.p1  ORF type:complete len:475 (+),score=102.32 gnl/MRDRNA2_/MRDRNA2_28597_c0_seq2:186-1610(+)